MKKSCFFCFRCQTSKQIDDKKKIERIGIMHDEYEFDFDLSETLEFFGGSKSPPEVEPVA